MTWNTKVLRRGIAVASIGLYLLPTNPALAQKDNLPFSAAQGVLSDIAGSRKTFLQVQQTLAREDSNPKTKRSQENRNRILKELAIGMASSRDITRAKQTAKGIQGQAWEQARTLSAIAMRQAESGDRDGAKQTLAQARQVAGRLSLVLIVPQGATLFVQVAEGQHKLGNITGMRETLATALRKLEATKFHPDVRVREIRSIAIAHARFGDAARAEAVLQKLTGNAAILDVLCVCARALHNPNETEQE